MSHHLKIICAAAFVLTIGSLFAGNLHAETDWVIRPVMTSTETGSIYSADVMVTPDGSSVAVGYGFNEGTPQVARVNGRVFDYKSFSQSCIYPSFAMDDSGGVFYVGQIYNGPSVNGQDLGIWGGMQETIGQVPVVFSTVALDNHGVPAVAGFVNGYPMFSQFDMKTGDWLEREKITVFKSVISKSSMCFDSSNQAIVSFSHYGDGDFEVCVGSRTDLGWEVSSVDFCLTVARTSVATSPTGQTAVTYVSPDDGLMFATKNDYGFSCEVVGLDIGGRLLPNSLAFDPAGNPAIVYSKDLLGGDEVYLARRDSAGTWTTEILPVAGSAGSIAFDDAGNPYIAIVDSYPFFSGSTDSHSITLLGTNLQTALLLGDANNDGVVSAGDYACIQANYGNTGLPGLQGDANGDGVVSAADYASVRENFGNTADTVSSAIPEPATLFLATLGGIALLRRK